MAVALAAETYCHFRQWVFRMSEAGEPMTQPQDMTDDELAAEFLRIADSVRRAPAGSPCKVVRLRVADALLDEVLRRGQSAARAASNAD